ncbi:hypothetical protein [Ruminiclostridium cellulolyticum]|uniref:Heat shock protein DnaJ domain protein n=1 Tax=Ruminiclostridium cellulolyticum (strain ATCC 35319 / DSM 5812 / JCM 6584 / H10) TaxID=394503 RepID=B8I5W5_RUMCH|nr:hypothetical protein [Ruminiclostridium cellulolyticum]ACL74782.1 hypothetical protein Ccel_0397 [Ruminiclostridium cellulolyticum H10]
MKYTLKESRAIMEIPANSTKEDIEKKYDVILKKYRQMKIDGTLTEEAQEEFQKKTDAYRILMGYEAEEPKEPKKETYVDKAFVKAGMDRKKVDNFFHYHKYHILVTIAVVIIIASTVYSVVTKVEPDITIGILGEVNEQATNTLKQKITNSLPEIKEVGSETVMLSDRINDPNSAAYIQKAMILFAASDTDVFLLSKYVFDRYASDGAFMALDDVVRDLSIDVKSSEYLKLKVVEEWNQPQAPTEKRTVKSYSDSEPRLYGIDVTNSKFFKDVDVLGPEKILAVRAEPEKLELILKLIKLFAK